MARQPNSGNLWTEPAANGGTPTPVAAVLVKDGVDWTFATDGSDAEGAFIDVDGSGDYTLIDLTPVYIVADGSDYTLSTTGPAVAIIVADGSDYTISTDLTATAAAELYYDSGGDLWLVLTSCDRLDAVSINSSITTY
jgi:hypothetical protein